MAGISVNQPVFVCSCFVKSVTVHAAVLTCTSWPNLTELLFDYRVRLIVQPFMPGDVFLSARNAAATFDIAVASAHSTWFLMASTDQH